MAGSEAAHLEWAAPYWEAAIGWLWDLANRLTWPEQSWLRSIWLIALLVDLAALAAFLFPKFRKWLISSPELPIVDDGEDVDNSDINQGKPFDPRNFWQAGLTFLTGLIPVVTLFGPKDAGNAPLWATGSTVVLVVMAVTAVQLYGQQRNLAERTNQTIAINGIAAQINYLANNLLKEEEGEESQTIYDEPRSTISGSSERDERMGEPVDRETPSPIEDDNDLLGWSNIDDSEIEKFYNDWLAYEFRKYDSSIDLYKPVLDKINGISREFWTKTLKISSYQASQYVYQSGSIDGSDYLIEMSISQEWIRSWIDFLLDNSCYRGYFREDSVTFGILKDCLEFGVYQGAFHGLKLRRGLEATARDGYPFRLPGRGGIGRLI